MANLANETKNESVHMWNLLAHERSVLRVLTTRDKSTLCELCSTCLVLWWNMFYIVIPCVNRSQLTHGMTMKNSYIVTNFSQPFSKT